MASSSQRPQVSLDTFCRQFYNENILHPIIGGTNVSAVYFDKAREAVIETDPSFASVDPESFESEIKILRFEVFGEAWVHELSSHKLVEQFLLLQTLFTKKYLQEEGRLDIWEGMEPYNQAIAQVVNEFSEDTAAGRAYRTGTNDMRFRLWKGWCEQGFDEECAERASNRICPDEAWGKFITPWNLMVVLQDRLGCDVNEEAQFRITAVIWGLYDGARAALREVEIEL